MRFLRHSLTGLFLMSLTLGLLVYAGHTVFSAVQERITREPEIPERRERVFAVNVIEAVAGTETPVLTVFGEVESRRTLEIRAKTGGTLVELSEIFEDGGRVRVGQLLARIDPSEAQFALEWARNDLTDAEAEQREALRALELARDELAAAREQADLRERAFNRQLDLEQRGVGTAATVEAAELDAAQARQSVLARRLALATAEARVDQAATRQSRARIAFAEAQKELADTRITAEFSGTLRDVSVVQGRLVSANEKLAELIDPTALDVAFRVSTSQYARLLDETGQVINAPVRAVLDVYGLQLETTGRITRDSAAVDEGQTGRVIFARLDEARGMKPGDFVTVHVEEPPIDDVIRLPASALGPDGDVLVLAGDDRLRTVSVELLRRQGNEILVRSEDLEGLEVIAERSPLLGPGIKVRALRPETSARGLEEASEMLELSEDRRARLRAFVEASADIPQEMKTRLLGQLEESRVPASMVERLERRMGG